jgi:Ca2+-transporting ATPase
VAEETTEPPFSVRDPHAADLASLQATLATGLRGLPAREAASRLEQCGPNTLPKPEKDPAWRRILSQFKDPLVLTLLGAAVIAVFVASSEGQGSFISRYADAIAILLIVLLNAVIGYYQEQRADGPG